MLPRHSRESYFESNRYKSTGGQTNKYFDNRKATPHTRSKTVGKLQCLFAFEAQTPVGLVCYNSNACSLLLNGVL